MKQSYRTLTIIALTFCGVCLTGCPSDHEFNVNITRNASTPEEVFLIRVAEAAPPFDGDWSYRTFDNVPVADAVTAEAIDSYRDLIHQWQVEDLRQGNPTFVAVTFSYVANIEFLEGTPPSSEDRYVVSMQLEWSSWANSLAAMHFNCWRSVTLSPEGEVLDVYDVPGQLIVAK